MGLLAKLVAFAAGIFLLWLICKIFSVPLKILGKLVLNAIVGAVLLILFNVIGGTLLGAALPITIVTALITGFLGIFGVILLVVAKYVLFLF